MDIQGFRRINDDESAEFRWQYRVEQAKEAGLRLTTFDIIGGFLDDAGNYVYKAVEVRDFDTSELLGRYTPDEFNDVNYGEEGWFDALAPYDPCY